MATNTQPTYNPRRAKRRALASAGVGAEKRPKSGNNVSHAHNKTKRQFRPNLQKARIMVDGKLVSVRLPASEIRTLTKTQKDRKPVKPKHGVTKLQAKKASTKKAAPKAAAKK